ncbi:MAG TPA: hypothetical protein VFQ41_02545 [Candidatus Angelobacter sp.]|nr:hypothetical protein [Candidatus Angelobacter sp.]
MEFLQILTEIMTQNVTIRNEIYTRAKDDGLIPALAFAGVETSRRGKVPAEAFDASASVRFCMPKVD